VTATVSAVELSVEIAATTTWVVSGAAATVVVARDLEVDKEEVVVGTEAGVEEVEIAATTATSAAEVEDSTTTEVCGCTTATASEVEVGVADGVLLISTVEVASGVGQMVSYQTTIL
jgi:hypothetical protein